MTEQELLEKLVQLYQNEVDRLARALAESQLENRRLQEELLKLAEKLETKTVVVNPAPAPQVVPMTAPDYKPVFTSPTITCSGTAQVVPLPFTTVHS